MNRQTREFFEKIRKRSRPEQGAVCQNPRRFHHGPQVLVMNQQQQEFIRGLDGVLRRMRLLAMADQLRANFPECFHKLSFLQGYKYEA